MRLPPLVISHTETVLKEILLFAGPADGALSHYFRTHPKLGGRERAAIAEGVYAYLRHKSVLASFAESGVGPAMRRMALLGLAQAWGIEPLAGLEEVERSWLERVMGIDRTHLAHELQMNLPAWLWQALSTQLGAETAEALTRALNQPASLDLRVNTVKSDRAQVHAALREAGVHATETAYSPWGLRLDKKPNLQNMPLFKEGAIEVQDEGSQLLALVLGARRGEMVVDFCAGAGGKTLAIGAAMRNTGRLYAFDISEKRLSKIKPRLARSGLSNVHPVLIAHERDAKIKRLAGKIDRVLIDAPCSGLGTLRRNPDMKWRQTPEDVAQLNQKQSAILDSAARLLKPGGRLVYATCSVLREENEAIVDAFLASHPQFVVRPMRSVLAEQKIALEMQDYLKLWPHQHGTDGFFAAVLERTSDAA